MLEAKAALEYLGVTNSAKVAAKEVVDSASFMFYLGVYDILRQRENMKRRVGMRT